MNTVRRKKNPMALHTSTIRTGRRYRKLILLSTMVISIVALGVLALSTLWPDRARTGAQAATVSSSKASTSSSPAKTKSGSTITRTAPNLPNATPARKKSLGPDARRGVYLTALAAAKSSKIDEIIQKSAALGLNAIVIDIKDNHGVVAYESQVALAKTIGARTNRLNLKALLPKLKSHGLYVIARHVLFYDPKLAKHLQSPIKPWVLPTDHRVVQYNLAIAEEAAALGFDEIQFDYARYPDPEKGAKLKPIYASRYDAITSFVRQVRARLGSKVYLSADVFGRTLWAWNVKKIDPIGQHLEALNPYLDYLSPMIYPSHYETEKLRSDPYGTIKLALQAGLKRELKLRPFLQAFDLRIPHTMSYAQYIAHQIKAVHELGFEGYLFWNPESNYATLWKVLEQVQKQNQ